MQVIYGRRDSKRDSRVASSKNRADRGWEV